MLGCSPGGLLSLHLVNIKRWLLFPRMAPVLSALILVCFPERQTGFLQFWPSVTLARCYIFTSPFRLSSHIHVIRKQCLSAVVACRSIHSSVHCPSTCHILSRYPRRPQFVLLKFYVKGESVKRFSKLLANHGVLFNPPSGKEEGMAQLQTSQDAIRQDIVQWQGKKGVHWSVG